MGKKARTKSGAKKTPREAGPEAASNTSIPDAPLEPIATSPLGFLFIVGAVVTMAYVALWFQLDVNRVFDMPKALVLKLGGCSMLIVWLAAATFGRGVAWKSARVFAAPLLALILSVAFSTAFSIDPWMSLVGVYERQFGLQGYLACFGLFLVLATSLRSKRGALAALGSLMVVGGIVGAYAYLQSKGWDPYGFFKKPHNKVYSTLGNATFAGNALALLFPVSAMLATVASATSLGRRRGDGDAQQMDRAIGWTIGLVLTLALVLGPSILAADDPTFSAETRQSYLKASIGAAVVLLIFLASVGSFGFDAVRLETRAGRRLADSTLAGTLIAFVLMMAVGLLKTRTRGAWVGTSAAIASGLLLLPLLFRDRPETARRLRAAGAGALVTLAIGLGVLLIGYPDHLYSRTIKSIPHAFDTSSKHGKGQGTRRYLWAESPRVLIDHRDTLARAALDQQIHEERRPIVPDQLEPVGSLLDRLLVWPFGIGFETYRYAFMSHKSKRLEALDPMTNHDNPHNNYLYVFATTGLLGLAAYLWLLWRLLETSWHNFYGRRQRLFGGTPEQPEPLVVVQRWTKSEKKLHLWALNPDDVGRQISEQLGIGYTIESEAIVLEGDPDELLARLQPLSVRTSQGRVHRAIAFGVLTSFCSYVVYSIAGFDSVTSSVFLFFILGCSAVFFEPNEEAPTLPLADQLAVQWCEFRARARPDRLPGLALGIPLLVVGLVAALSTVSITWSLYQAERSFVGQGRGSTFQDRIANIERAIELNPRESYYHQTLGSTYLRAAQQYFRAADEAAQQGKTTEREQMNRQAEVFEKKAELALYDSLEHPWAPENIYISLFQVFSISNRMQEAQDALKLALVHSPHLGPVRANLAVLELEQGHAPEAALRDCQWVLEIEPSNVAALRTCGRAAFMLGDPAKAKRYLEKAKKLAPRDRLVDRYLEELAKPSNSTTTG